MKLLAVKRGCCLGLAHGPQVRCPPASSRCLASLIRRHRATATQHIENRDTRTDRTQRGRITSMVSATSRKEGYDAHCTVSVVTSFRVVVRTQKPNTHAHQHRSSSVDTLPSSSTVIHFVLFCHGSQITTFTNISKRWCIAWTHVRLAHGIAEAQP
jgi:hypothetical protein